MKRTSRRARRRTSRNPTSQLRKNASRQKKLAALESKVTRDLHKFTMAWKGTPALTIQEERAIDSMALAATRLRDLLGAEPRRGSTTLSHKVADALGYTYPGSHR